MRSKMERFLESIGISDPERFDMDFTSLGYVAKGGRQVFRMVIRKHSFWTYPEVRDFLDGLVNIAYPYELSFHYDAEPSLQDIDSLFYDKCLDAFHLLPHSHIREAGGNLRYFEEGSSFRKIVDDFNDLLRFLCFPKTVIFGDDPAEAAEKTPVETPLFDSEKPVEAGRGENGEEEPENAAESAQDPKEFSSDIDDKSREEWEEMKKQAEADYIKNVVEERQQNLRKSKEYVMLHNVRELLSYSSGNFTVDGYVYEANPRPNKTGRMTNLLSFADETGGIHVRMMEMRGGLTADEVNSIQKIDKLEQCKRYRISGNLEYDSYLRETILMCKAIEPAPELPLRKDEEPEKRVELHLHTKMSAMDATGEIEDYCKAAKAMGMKALAVTDHGDLQSFPAAEAAGKKYGVKIIYGCEFYMFDWPTYAFNPSDVELNKGRYCVFDFETTGLSNELDRITEFGAVLIEDGVLTRRIDFFVNAGITIPDKIVQKTKITNEMIKSQGISESEAIKRIEEFSRDAIMVSHNAPFDVGFLNAMRRRQGLGKIENPVIDTLAISYFLYPEASRHTLGALSRALGLSVYDDGDAHRADYDAEVLSHVWFAVIAMLEKDRPNLTMKDLAALSHNERGIYTHLKTQHVIALAKNQEGLKALYRLVSDSSTTYLATGQVSLPKIPREELQKERKNLLLGSACFNGDVFKTASERSKEDLLNAVQFYDYIEIQPKENYSYLINIGELTSERLDFVLASIVEAADKLGKPIVATGDCHYVNPEDKETRDVYISSFGMGGVSHPLFPRFRERMDYFPNPDQHFRTTREMLDCFEWMGKDRAREAVIRNSNMIADEIGEVEILKKKLYTPDSNLPGSAEKLRAICYDTLHKTYGPNPDPLIVERLEKELNGIISNGYSVTYYIAHLICKKVREDGYVFGSRGSVGSSFTATMAGVTEVNPLPPHYVCPKCYHFEWADPEVRSGFDLPDKKCPVCGEKLKKDGQTIPFETFLGFHAEKVPDIDLNFPPDYQATAHAFARTLLSTPEENEKYARHEEVKNPHVIRAGTISTAEKKNAFSYIKKFYYPRLLHKDPESANKVALGWLAMRCTGVKRTTGQHPGGIVVIPSDMDIFDFTAYQHPADNLEKDWLTTHYEFASMHDSVLKLDLLGHVDPQALRMMSLLTGVSIYDIPMDDKKVISLFSSEKELKLKKNPLGFKTGAIALPEFGTNFVQGLLEEARPKNFNELLCVSGLSHGTNVWHSNAEDIINSGIAKLTEVIGCRDDIMNFLIGKGMEPGTAFDIMEKVRKAKGLSPEHEAAMRKAGVPDYYIDSCKKIKYLFPRAHATAYVMGAVRVAYFKLYHPLEFYATYFTCRCEKYNLEAMAKGFDALIADIDKLRSSDDPSGTDDEIIKSDIAALEMYDRGFKIQNVSLEKSLCEEWRVDRESGSIIPPFTSISNFPIKTAESIVKARADGPFISKEDLADRAQVGGSLMKVLDEMKITDALGESNQMSLFDFAF